MSCLSEWDSYAAQLMRFGVACNSVDFHTGQASMNVALY